MQKSWLVVASNVASEIYRDSRDCVAIGAESRPRALLRRAEYEPALVRRKGAMFTLSWYDFIGREIRPMSKAQSSLAKMDDGLQQRRRVARHSAGTFRCSRTSVGRFAKSRFTFAINRKDNGPSPPRHLNFYSNGPRLSRSPTDRAEWAPGFAVGCRGHIGLLCWIYQINHRHLSLSGACSVIHDRCAQGKTVGGDNGNRDNT